MTLPNFLVIGAQKSGTTSLHRYLQGHPQVFLPDWKEPGFFVEEQTWSRGREWYEQLFAGAVGATAIGEASTSYTMFPYFAGVPGRIAEHLPDVRLVYLLRDPIERMRSAYVHELASGAEHRPIREALLEGTKYLALSQYALQIEQYLEHFDPGQVLLVLSEDLDHRPTHLLERIFDFIGVPPWSPPELGTRHHRSAAKRAPRGLVRRAGGTIIRTMHAMGRPTGGERPIELRGRVLTRGIRADETVVDDDLRERLAGMLAPDIARLRTLMVEEFSGWGIG